MELNKMLKQMSKETGISVEQIAKIIVANHLLGILEVKYPSDLIDLDIKIDKNVKKELNVIAKVLEVSVDALVTVAAYHGLKEGR
jgi:hypothetical protein